jgi:hypothetical protein
MPFFRDIYPYLKNKTLFARSSRFILTLPESSALPSIWSTRQSLKNTRQSLYWVWHATKSLSSVTRGKESSANITSATTSLPSTFYRSLGKVFPECHLVLGKEKPSSRRLVTETAPLPSVYRPTLGKGPPARPFVSFFAECARRHSAKLASLPSARVTALAKAGFFAECQGHITHQRSFTGAQVFPLCRVLWHWHSSKWTIHTFLICFFYYIQTNKRYHIYITDIT